MKLTNDIRLYCCSMGKVFRVTRICNTTEEANEAMKRDRESAMIAEDGEGRIFLARQYGSVAPSEILKDVP